MKTSEPNSAECYESSETRDRNNQHIADALDACILELTQATEALLAARIRVQREAFPVQLGHDLEKLREMSAGLRETCRQVREEAIRECTHTGQIDPSDYVRA